jgi:hypothetical protein
MAIRYEADLARLEQDCAVEEALDLADWLRGQADPAVDMSACTHLHTAVLQTLLALRPRLVAPPAEPFLARWLTSLLESSAPQAATKPSRPRRRKSKNEPEKPGTAS